MLDKLGLTLNRSSMRDRVIHQAILLHEQIFSEVIGKLVCFNFDIASPRKVGFFKNKRSIHSRRMSYNTYTVSERDVLTPYR